MIAKGVFNMLLGAFSLLKIEVSGRYNGLYGAGDALDMLLAMCDGGRYAPTAAAQLRSRGERGRRIPTPQWLLGKLRLVGRAAMEKRARRMIESTVRALQEEGMLRRPVTVAMDKTLIPFYGGHEDMTGRIYSKHDRGTHVFEAYATAQCVDGPCRAQLAARTVERGEFLSRIVRKLLGDLARSRIKVRRLLLDREFFKISVINELVSRGIPYVMPAIRTRGIEKAIIEHASGARAAVSKYVLRSVPDGTEAEINLVILKKKGVRAKDAPVEERYVAFATNLPRPSVAGLLVDLPGEYRMRWGIETGYRDVKRIRLMTASRSLSVRIAFFFFSLAMYNAWILSRCQARSDGLACIALFILISYMIYGIPPAVPRDRGKPS